jgi:hypothetical protein
VKKTLQGISTARIQIYIANNVENVPSYLQISLVRSTRGSPLPISHFTDLIDLIKVRLNGFVNNKISSIVDVLS